MEKTNREHLSAIFDGEIELDKEIDLREWSHHKGTQAQLERYSLIRGVLKEEALVDDGFLSKVKLSLEHEPVVLAPVRKKNKTYITLSLAASFLLFAVLVLTFSLNESNDSGFQSMAEVGSDKEAPSTYTESSSRGSVQPKARLVTFGK